MAAATAHRGSRSADSCCAARASHVMMIVPPAPSGLPGGPDRVLHAVRQRDVQQLRRRCRCRARSPSRRTSSPRRSGSASFGSVGSSTNVADSIGQLLSPGWSFRSMAKFCTLDQSALAAAALKLSMVGETNLPALLRSCVGGQVVLLGIGAFDVADAALDVVHRAGDAVAALGAGAGRPLDAGGGSDLGSSTPGSASTDSR